MPLIDRDTLVDRPVLFDREGEDELEVDDDEVLTLGRGGGPIINGVEFEQHSYDTVACANMSALLTSNQDSGVGYETTFRNAAYQLHQLVKDGEDITPMSDLASSIGLDLVNIDDDAAAQLLSSSTTESSANVNIEEYSVKKADDDEDAENSEEDIYEDAELDEYKDSDDEQKSEESDDEETN